MQHPAITDYLLSQGLQFGTDFETVDRSDGIGPRLVMLHGVEFEAFDVVERQHISISPMSLPEDFPGMPTQKDLDAFSKQQAAQLAQAASDKTSADKQRDSDIQTLKDGLSKSKDPLIQAMLRIILENPSQVNRNLFKP